MKIEGTIDEFKDRRGYYLDDKYRLECYDTAISALEKQIPKLPEHKVHEKYPSLGKNYYCKCGVMFVNWENYSTNYCGNCGQKLRENERND